MRHRREQKSRNKTAGKQEQDRARDYERQNRRGEKLESLKFKKSLKSRECLRGEQFSKRERIKSEWKSIRVEEHLTRKEGGHQSFCSFLGF